MQRRHAFVLLLGTIGLLGARAQENQQEPQRPRRPGPQAPRPTPMEEDSEAEKKRSEAALKEQRKENKERLDKDLSGLIELAQNIQKELRVTDTETHLPVALIRQSEKLEDAAKQIAKRFRNW